jgi:hypothetical protein
LVYLFFDSALRSLGIVIEQLLMAVEIRVFLAVDAFPQNSGTVLAFSWMLFLSPAKQVLDSKCKAFGTEFSDASAIPSITIAHAKKARFLTAIIARIPVAANNSHNSDA